MNNQEYMSYEQYLVDVKKGIVTDQGNCPSTGSATIHAPSLEVGKEYKMVLFADGGYNPIAIVRFAFVKPI